MSSLPASSYRSGQQARGPSDIPTRKVGPCLDLTLLYASRLEQAGLNPVLALTEGHAFVGLWVDEDFSSLVDDPQMLRIHPSWAGGQGLTDSTS